MSDDPKETTTGQQDGGTHPPVVLQGRTVSADDEPIMLATGEVEMVSEPPAPPEVDQSPRVISTLGEDEDTAVGLPGMDPASTPDVDDEPLDLEDASSPDLIEDSLGPDEPTKPAMSFSTVEPDENIEPDGSPADEPVVLAVPASPLAEERMFYVHEARALADRQPERSALMWLEAAVAGERGELGVEQIHEDLDAALDLRPDSAWLVRRARRLVMRLGSYERALKLAQAEVKIGGDTTGNAAVLVEGAAVVRYRLTKPGPALKLIEQALKLRSRYVPALAWAVALREQLGSYEEAAEVLETLGECLTDPAQRALCLYGAGTLCEARLQRLDEAQAAYTRAAEADPQNLPVQLALVQLYSRTEQWQALSRALEHLADLFDEAGDKARLLQQAGSLHLDRTGNLDAAGRDLSRAIRAEADNPAAVQRLVYTYEAKGAHRDLAQTLRQLLTLTPDRQGRAAILTQIAALHTSLHEVEQAIGAYREALEQMDGYLPALQALGMIYRQRGDYESLVVISEPETEGLLPAAARAVRHVERAEILAEHLDRPEDAVTAYNRALELEPNLWVAYWGLAALLRRLGWHEQLAELLARQAAATKDARTRAHLLLERARLQAGPLGAPAAAVETLLGGVDVDQGSRSMTFELLELYASTESHVELVSLLLAQAEATEDPAEREGRKIQAGQVLEFELEEYDRALKLYREVLEANPNSHAAIHGAGRVLHRTGAWSELIKLHHHELVTDPERPDASILLCRVGRILTEHLGNRGAAIKAYSKALRQDPNCTPALVALDGLVRQEKRWPELVEVLEQYATSHGDDLAAAMALCRAGEVACWQLGELDQASDLFERALERQPGMPTAIQGLLQVRLRQSRWSAAIESLELLLEQATSPEQRAALLLQQARLRELWLGEAPDVSLYSQAAQGPFGSSLREELLRVHRLTSSPEVMAEQLAELGRKTTDDALGAAYLLEAAQLREFGAGTVGLEELSEAYRRKPEDLAVIWALERALIQRQQWRPLAELCEREAQLELDRAVRVQRLTSAAEAYRRAGATDEATRVCRECLNFDAHCLPALRLLARLAQEDEQWRSLAELCDRLAEACTDRRNRLESCLRSAEIWTDKVGDTTRALASLAVALADDPGEPEAFDRAESLMRARCDFDELSRLYQRRIRACRESGVKVELLRKHAQLLGEDLTRPDRAVAELSTLLELAPADVDGLSSLAKLHGKLGHWSDAASTLGQLIERADDAEIRHQARLQQAELWLQRLHDPKRARATLEQAASDRPDDLEVRKLMVQLAMNTGEWSEARAALEQLNDCADADARTWALLRLVEVAQLGLRDDALAERATAAAVRLAASDEQALASLRKAYPTPEERRRLAEIAKRQANSDGVPGDERVSLLELAAMILLEDVNQPQEAVAYLREIEKDQPSPRTALLLAKALERQGDSAGAAERYHLLLEADGASLEAYRGLVRTGSAEVGAAAATLVERFGEVGPEETVALKTLEVERGPRGVFSAADLTFAGAEPGLSELLSAAAPYLEDLFGRSAGQPLESSHDAAQAAQSLSRALGLGELRLEVGELPDGKLASVDIGLPLPLVLTPALVEQAGTASFRFWVGRALAQASGGYAALQRLSDGELEDLVAAIYARRPPSEAAQRLKKQIGKQLPRRTRKQLEAISAPKADATFWRGLRAALDEHADRLGLVLARQPAEALLQVAGEDKTLAQLAEGDTAPLLRFVLSEAYTQLCRQVW